MNLEELLESFNVPQSRKDIKKEENVRWLIRNIGIQNSDNPLLKQVVAELVKCLRSF